MARKVQKKRGNGEGSYYQRPNGTWVGQVVVGKKADGTLDRRAVSGKTKQEVANKMAKLKSDALDGNLTKRTNLTLGRYLWQWLDYHRNFAGGAGLRPNTYRIYERMIRLHIEPCIGNIQVSKINVSHLRRLYDEITIKKGLSKRMGEIAHSVLHMALDTAVREDQILKMNPCDLLKNKPQSSYDPQDRPVLTKEQGMAVLREVQNTIYYIPFLIAMTTGMRRSEIAALRWENVDLDNRIISVREQLQPDADKKLTVHPPKTRCSQRDILIPQDVAEFLCRHQASPEDYVCTNTKGNRLRPDDISHAWAKIRTKLGFPEQLTFHDIRHSFTNWQAEAGVDVKTVSKILGHADERTTLSVYRSVTDKMKQEAAKAVEGFAKQST